MSCSCNCCQKHNEHHHHHHVVNQQMMKKRLIRLCIASGLFLLLFIVDKIVELADVDLGIPNWILPFVLYFLLLQEPCHLTFVVENCWHLSGQAYYPWTALTLSP